jgi:hypothetical protein
MHVYSGSVPNDPKEIGRWVNEKSLRELVQSILKYIKIFE